MQQILNVRELKEEECDLIIDYWKSCSKEYLISLGADIDKFPNWVDLHKSLQEQSKLPYYKKSSYALIWEIDGIASGHCNVNNIEFGKTAKMHLHLWNNSERKRGMGQLLVEASLPFFFDHLQLEYLLCEPYSLNPAPNKTLEKVGFDFVKSHKCIPGYLNFEQVVNTWKMARSTFENLISKRY